MTKILCGDVLQQLRTLPDESVNCCVTSPPYWGLRDYQIPPQVWGGDPYHSHEWGVEIKAHSTSGFHRRKQQTVTGGIKNFSSRANGQGSFCECGAWLGSLGLEPTPELYVAHVVEIFQEVRRVLRSDGTLWLNLGDCYSGGNKGNSGPMRPNCKQASNIGSMSTRRRDTGPLSPTRAGGYDGLKVKDLVGIPWRVAFALQADGWYLRSDIIWHKTNPMPESVKDRPTKTHEYLFLLAKSERYYYDADAIKEPASPDTHARYARGRGDKHKWADGGPGGQTIATNGPGSLFARKPGVNPKCAAPGHGIKQNASFSAAVKDVVGSRNKRSVWKINVHPYKGAHFATFPPALVEPCILAGCPPGGTVLDPFAGAFTTPMVAEQLGRDWIAIELNPEYVKLGRQRLGMRTKAA